jgi:hypothetical protein
VRSGTRVKSLAMRPTRWAFRFLIVSAGGLSRGWPTFDDFWLHVLPTTTEDAPPAGSEEPIVHSLR